MDLLAVSGGIEGRFCCIPSSDSDNPKAVTNHANHGCRHLPLPHRNAQNSNESSISMDLRSGPHGMHALASRDIKAGSMIVQCLPLAHTLLVPPGSPAEGGGDDDGDRRRRCTRCFFREGDDDGDGTRKRIFGRCSKCRAVHYCSRSCQADDWNEQHKLECQYYVKRRKTSNSMSFATSRDEDAIPLLLRTFRALTFLRGKPTGEENANADVSQVHAQCGESIVSCGPRHFSSLMVSPEHLRSATAVTASGSPAMALAKDQMTSHAVKNDRTRDGADAVRHIWGYKSNGAAHDSDADRAIQRALNAFQKNNFGIVNSLHSAIGEGVYPCAALLNHSCCPNSILRYRLGAAKGTGEQRYHPPILQIVACRDISAGEEISHSYVDLALCTPERQKRLLDTHGFVCECRRCTKGGCMVELPEKRKDWELSPLMKERRSQEGRLASQPESRLLKVDLDEAMGGCRELSRNEAQIIHQSRLLQEKSKECMVEGDVPGEMHHLEKAVELYSSSGKCLAPFNSQLYSVRCSYLSALLANGRICEAVTQCEHVVSTLAVAFSHVQNHPLLGLQLYTLGDLYSAAATMKDGMAEGAAHAWTKKAKFAYTWAKRVMTITHGANDPMVRTLAENLTNLIDVP